MTACNANPPPICMCLRPIFLDVIYDCEQCAEEQADQYQRDALAEAQAVRPDEETAEDIG
jgi:hypothetical protein